MQPPSEVARDAGVERQLARSKEATDELVRRQAEEKAAKRDATKKRFASLLASSAEMVLI